MLAPKFGNIIRSADRENSHRERSGKIASANHIKVDFIYCHYRIYIHRFYGFRFHSHNVYSIFYWRLSRFWILFSVPNSFHRNRDFVFNWRNVLFSSKLLSFSILQTNTQIATLQRSTQLRRRIQEHAQTCCFHGYNYGYISYHAVSCYSAFGFLIFHGQFARLAYTPKFFRQKGLNPKNTKSDKRISEKKFILSLFIYKACNTGYKLLLKLPYWNLH